MIVALDDSRAKRKEATTQIMVRKDEEGCWMYRILPLKLRSDSHSMSFMHNLQTKFGLKKNKIVSPKSVIAVRPSVIFMLIFF